MFTSQVESSYYSKISTLLNFLCNLTLFAKTNFVGIFISHFSKYRASNFTESKSAKKKEYIILILN